MNKPDLRLGKSFSKPVPRSHFIPVDFVLARFDVDGDEFILILGREIGTDLALE